MRLLLPLLLCGTLTAQGQFTSFITGDSSDLITTDHLPGVVLAGGGPDNDNAMRWMLERAGGGDVLVLRASASDGYNPYFFGQLGVVVNSVETIRFDGPAASNDPYVIRRIQEAELIFFAGGDQTRYVNYWRNTAVDSAINRLVVEKMITIGGTSAGMAIMGQYYYAPTGVSLISPEALSNPYHPNSSGFSGAPFLQLPFLENAITDTHFAQRDREGRGLTLLARMTELTDDPPLLIAANEATAVCVDENGIARVFGDYPNFNDFAYFLQPGCTDGASGPESMIAGRPLDWNRSERAVSVYAVPGNSEGTAFFDLTERARGESGNWENWWVDQGVWRRSLMGLPPGSCVPSSAADPAWEYAQLLLSPTLITDRTELSGTFPALIRSEIVDALGRRLRQFPGDQRIFDLSDLPAGTYWFRFSGRSGRSITRTIVKQ